jgi:hypothetical protein
MAKIKGVALKSTIEFLKARLGEEGFAKLLESATPEEAAIFKAPVLLSNWYEFSLLRKLMKLAEGKVALTTGRSLPWEMGRFSAEAALSSIYKLFFKVADVSFIVKKASYLFPTLYDSGEMELVESRANGAIMRIKNFDEFSPEFCDRMQGWMERTVELTGHKRVIIEHPKCRVRGDAYCEYHGRWD